MALYERKKKLIDMCEELKKYEIEDITLIDKFFQSSAGAFTVFITVWSTSHPFTNHKN